VDDLAFQFSLLWIILKPDLMIGNSAIVAQYWLLAGTDASVI